MRAVQKRTAYGQGMHQPQMITDDTDKKNITIGVYLCSSVACLRLGIRGLKVKNTFAFS
jgi:hypothetical protein